MTDYKQLYDQHADFRRFVDKAMHDHGYTLEQALEVKTLQDVGDYYMKGGANGTGVRISPIEEDTDEK